MEVVLEPEIGSIEREEQFGNELHRRRHDDDGGLLLLRRDALWSICDRTVEIVAVRMHGCICSSL